MTKLQQELTIGVIFILVLLLLLNPFGLFMPDRLVYIMLIGIVVLFGVHAWFIATSKPSDEREQLHNFIANRSAYLAGTAVLIVGAVYEGVTSYEINTWILLALGVMLIIKLSSLLYSDKNR